MSNDLLRSSRPYTVIPKKRSVALALLCGLTLLLTASASAQNDAALVRILGRADIADQFTEYCAQFDPSIVQSTRGAIGDTRALALHIRGEVVSGLPTTEAGQIILRAAQAARAGALLAVRRLYGPDSNETKARITKWCQAKVEPDIKDYVNAHDFHHDRLTAAIQNAKQAH